MSYPNGLEDAAPTYLSGHMADVVLSEFRPTRIKPDALRCVNVLLDELLWSIVKSARSISTERLKSDGILRVIPAALGKEAVLEAEMELREYWKNSGDSREAYRDIKENPGSFPTPQVFDVLRLKCEANSSLGGAEDEDAIAVEKAENRLFQVNSALPLEAFAPASLYLTAILEHVCGHIMSCVSRVVARDAGKTSASISDLYSALCEDQSLYNMVKTMTSFSNIETQHRAKGVQRKGSLSGSLASARSRAAPSPRPGYEPAQPSPTSASAYSRASADSSGAGHSTVGANLHARPSIERKKVPPIVPVVNGTRQPGEAGYRQQTYALDDSALPNHAPHKRSGSGISDATKRAMAAFQDDNSLPSVDDGDSAEFEELMKAGSTMKVSLTPDRLKSFEVFARDRNMRAASRTGSGPAPAASTAPPSSFDASSAPPVPPLPSSTSFSSPSTKPRSMTPRGSSPTNDGYATDSAIIRRPNSRANSAAAGAGRTRLEPIPQMPLEPYGDVGNVQPSGSYSQRPRAATETRSTPPRITQLNDSASRNPGSIGTRTTISPLYEDPESSFSEFAEEKPKPVPKGPTGPREPKVSKSARDLIAFLDEGPPEEIAPLPRAGSTPAMSTMDGLKKSGSRGFMNSLRGFGRSTVGDKGGRMGAGADEFGRNTFNIRRQKSAAALVSSTTVSSLPPPPISPIKPVPPRIALGEKDSIPGIGSRYRTETPIPRPTKVDMPKHDDVHGKPFDMGGPDTTLPTPPASTESPLIKQYRDGATTLSPPISPSMNGTRGAPRTRPTTASSAAPTTADDYGTAVQGTHTRVAIDKVAESVVAEPGLTNGAASPEEQLRLLQKLIRAAGNIDECRLLVDSFLMQRGVRADATAAPSPAIPVSPLLKPLPPNPPEDDTEEKQVTDWLLSSDTSISATGIAAPLKASRSKPRERTTSNGYDRKKSRERLHK